MPLNDAPKPYDPARVSSAAQRAFGKIGESNATAPPAGGDNVDPFLHEKFIADRLFSMAKKRREYADTACVEFVGQEAIDKVTPGNSMALAQSNHFVYTVKVNNPVQRVTVSSFVTELRAIMKEAKLKLPQSMIDLAMIRGKQENKPAVTRTVSPISSVLNGDGG